MSRRWRTSGVALVSACVLAAVATAAVAFAENHGRGSVVVPVHAQQTDVVTAYEWLHAAGLRVALTRPIAIASLRVPIAARVVPRPGSSVPVHSVVRITPGFAPIANPAVLKSHPHYRVPRFVGRIAETAVAWAEERALFWAISRVPTLPPSTLPHLLDAYRVVAQRPRPGSQLGQGLTSRRGFRPTPLTLVVVRR